MTDTSDDVLWRPPDWLIQLLRLPWKTRKVIVGNLAISVIAGAVVAWLFYKASDLKSTPFEWFIQNSWWLLSIYVAWLVITFVISPLFYLVPLSGSETRRNDKEIRRGYLNQVRQDTELLTLKGIPAGLISESVRLDEVFIPLQLRPNRPRTDYPLTERELEQYRELRRIGKLSAAQEGAIVDAEHNWEHIHKESDRIGIADFWERLTTGQPAAVIQGAPGMGKSTLMERLTLYMARRSLGVADDDIPGHERIGPPLIPILLRLGEFALACEDMPGLKLEQHLRNVLSKFDIAGLDTFMIEQCLKNGRCLVLFDGLDEVSKPDTREKVQVAIKEFVRFYRNTPKESNRFIITSRIVGYDQDAFPAYAHFTVAELTPEQIDDFLPRWCKANVRRSLRGSIGDANGGDYEEVSREVDQRLADLRNAIQGHKAVQELAENPLLLTLLAVMQQNSIVLPRQRVELYSVVTITLLENRNIAKNLVPIPEGQAIKRLGPLAFEMQGKESLALEGDVIASLKETIGQAGGTPEQIAQEAKAFLSRIREHGGLFVQRTGDYFSFLHRTFQEYFAARYVLNEIEQDPVTWIPRFVEMARRSDDLWREPFLLAVGYQSKANKKVANDLLQALIPASLASQDEQEHDALLSAECVIEAKPLSIDAIHEKKIAGQLLQCYEISQRRRDFNSCTKIEAMMRRWLLSLPREAYRPQLLESLYKSITDATQSKRQVATLTMLTKIAQELDACPPIVFDRLIPPLLSLTSLPEAGDYRPSAAVPVSTDLNVADLALTALSFLGRKGPPGSLLTTVVQSALASQQDISEIRQAIGNERFPDYQRLAEAIIRRMQATDPHLIDSPYFDNGTVWKISLPVFGLRLRTQEAILLLRQKDYGRASYERLNAIQRQQDAQFSIIVDIMDIRTPPSPITSQTVWFRPESLMDMVITSKEELLGWLGRFITTQVDVELLLPYRAQGATKYLFFGREDELAKLLGGDMRGGIIVGAHRSGKTSLLYQLGESLKQRGLTVVGPITFTGVEEFQSFFEQTLSPLKIDCPPEMTPALWASVLRTYSKEQNKSPVFLLDEVDDLLAIDTNAELKLEKQMRSLQMDGHSEFYLAGHRRLREAIGLEEGPLRNFAEEIFLRGLTPNASKRLIQEPMRDIGFYISDNKAERIFKGTAGVAVLIQEFCIRLLCGRFHLDSKPEIEEPAIEAVEHSPEYLYEVFKHYKYGQSWIEMSIMLLVAIHNEVTRQHLTEEFRKRNVPLKRDLLDPALEFLIKFGVLEEFTSGHYRIWSSYLHNAIMNRDPHSLLNEKILEGRQA